MSSPQRPSKVRDGSIELFRWICILAVLVQHSVFPARQSPATVESLLVLKSLLLWCVPGFFFVSGWFTNPSDGFVALLGNRAKRLLLPYLGVNLLIIAGMLALIHSGLYLPKDHELWNLKYIAIRMVYLQGVGPQFYFLPYLFLVTLLTVATVKAAGRTGGFALWCAALAALCLGHGLPATSLGSELDRMPLYCAAFAAGMALRDGFCTRTTWALAVGALATGLGLAIAGAGTSIFHGFVAIPIFYALRGLFGKRDLRWLSGWNSGAVYLWHAPFILTACSIAWFKVGARDGLGLSLALLSTVVACQLIQRLIARTPLAPYLSL